MNLTAILPDLSEVPSEYVDESVFDAFVRFYADRGISLYPAQEEAILGILANDNVILATPTGSGKTMVATAAQFIALSRGQRTFYSAPIKALVNEKFFALCDLFGAESVGLMTGDATVNGSAPIICATAEVIANIALRQGSDSPIDQVIMDEFHFYSDPDRGWAWQVPILELPKAQFLLMSATLGDTGWLEDDLTRRTGRRTSLVAGSTRPVPLDFSYVYTPPGETIEEVLQKNLAPVYVVHASQRQALDQAQALATVKLIDQDQKAAIVEEIGSFRFSTAFGKELSKLLRRGIGVHHAGLLPKYRRLVERLSQKGLLPVICGTDTLGVGINVPIRTVLMTSLAKFDGRKQRIMRSREFHQIAGRAGRAGFDTQGTVIVEAPAHEIENWRLRERAGSDPKKLKKLRLKAARDGEVTWGERTFHKVIEQEPEPLRSQFQVSHSMVLNVIGRCGNTFEHFRHLLRDNHDKRPKQNADILRTIDMVRGLINASIVEEGTSPGCLQLTEDLQRDFALNQPLAPFAVAALELLDPQSATYSFDVISTIEAILQDPPQVLRAQEQAARSRELAALKAEGVDYHERVALLEEVTYPMPLEEELDAAFSSYCTGHPWARDFDISPKSIVRDMLERGMTFSDMVATYKIARAEGILLRYLNEAWRTLSHTIPVEFLNDELEDIIVWLGELIEQVDSSLVDEWAHMADPDAPLSQDVVDRELAFGVEDPNALTANRRAFIVMVRNALFRLVRLFADEREDEFDEYVEYLGDDRPDLGAALDAYFDEYDDLDDGPAARGPEYFYLEEGSPSPRRWAFRQIIKDPNDDNAFSFSGVIDLDASDEAGEVRFESLTIDY